jgi:hypothetical protein
MDWVGYAGKVALTHDAARMFVITHTGSVPDTGPVVLHIVPNPTLPQLTATLSVTTNLTTYAYGATAIVTARLGATHDSRLLTIYATPYRGVKRRIASGNADATGRLVAKVIVQGTTTITARFEGDDRYRASAATARVTSPAKIVAKLSRNYGRSGHVHLYRPAKNPLLSVHVRPEAAGVCIGYRLQRKYGGSWHMLARPNCFSLDVHGRHAVVINGTHVVGSLYRVRARLRKSGYTPETAFGHWKYFRYRHR